MFDKQIQRAKDHMLPFAYIGLFVGIVIGKASWFRSFGWLGDYFRYASIDTRYPDSGQILFLKHFDPDTLTFLLIAIVVFAAVHRIFFGVKEIDPAYKGITRSLENFGSLLAIAWLGLTFGITLPTLIYQGFASSVSFLIHAVYPLLFLIEVSICTAFLSGDSLCKVREFIARRNPGKLGVRAEGLVVFGLALLMFTYQGKHSNTIESFTFWVESLL